MTRRQREMRQTRPLKPARVALNVLALCFALALARPRPRRELYGFPETDRGEFRLGPRPGGLGLFADLARGRTDGAAGRPAVRPLRPAHRLFARAAAARRRVPGRLAARRRSGNSSFRASGSCVGIGIAFIGNVPNSILLGRWFGPRLPTAMAVVYSATGAGVLVLLPASQILIDHLGWRDAYQIVRHRRAVPAGAAAAAAVAAVRHRLAACRAEEPTPVSSTRAGRCRAPCATTPSGRCSRPSSSRRSAMYAHHGADRRLSDRCRLPAAAGGDRLGLFRRRAVVRHARA